MFLAVLTLGIEASPFVSSAESLSPSQQATVSQNGDLSNEIASVRGNSMYCWYESDLSDPEHVIERFHSLDVTDAYIGITNFEKKSDLILTLKENGISTYYLTGRSYWYQTPEAVTEKIDKIYEYNCNHPDCTIIGIVLDIEPYVLDDYKADVISGFESYANTMEEIYAYAKSKNIKLVNAIPNWYDSYMTKAAFTTEEQAKAEELFQKVMQNADRISVMNYLRRNMASQIENELNYAKEYHVEIESVADFCQPSGTAVLEEATFYWEKNPIQAAWNAWEQVSSTFDYDKLKFSYHHLGMILQIDSRPSISDDESKGADAESNLPEAEADEETKSPTQIDVSSEGKPDPDLRTGQTITVGANRYKVLSQKEISYVGTPNTKAKKITIPAVITLGDQTLKVTEIAKGALKNSKITSVVLGANIKRINPSAFENCKKLTKITMGSKITYIGKNAFKSCTSLKRISIPAKVTTIGKNAFYGCKRLKTISMTAGKLKSIGKNAFKGIDKKATFKLKGSKKTKRAHKKRLKNKRIGYVKTWHFV